MNRRLFLARVGIVAAAPALCACANGQTNKPIPSQHMPNDGRPYALVPIGKERSWISRMCPYWESESEDKTEKCRLWVGAHKLLYSNGAKKRWLQIIVRTIPKEDATRSTSVMIAPDEAATAIVRLNDVLRIARTWRREGVPVEDKSVDIVPVTDMKCSVTKLRGDASQFPIVIVVKDGVLVLHNLADFADFVKTCETYAAWLEES